MNIPLLRTAAFLAVLFLSTHVFAESDKYRPVIQDLALPYPITLPDFPPVRALNHLQGLTTFEPVLLINKKGKVENIICPEPCDSIIFKYVHSYISALEFEPALQNGKKTAARLPIRLLFRLGRFFPEFQFPLDTTLFVGDHQLLRKAYAANEIIFPTLTYFPSYSGFIDSEDSSLVYPFVIVKVDIGADGALTAVKTVASTLESSNTQMESACLYAKFKPAIVRGEAASSSAYVVISFFHRIKYPLGPWNLDNYEAMSPTKRATIRLIADTSGMICPPVPRRHAGDSLKIASLSTNLKNVLNYTLKIDTTGIPRYFIESQRFSRELIAMNKIKPMISFYPAIRSDSSPLKFEGQARFSFNGSINVRVDYFWLDRP